MTTSIQQRQGPGMLLLRLIYFLVIGLWLSSIWVTVAWVLCVTILGLPIGLWMLNKLPQIATLQPERQDLTITTEGRIYQMHKPQPNFFLRAIYFLLIGWWFSALWLSVAWALSASILGLPIAFWMFNRVPGVITLANT